MQRIFSRTRMGRDGRGRRLAGGVAVLLWTACTGYDKDDGSAGAGSTGQGSGAPNTENGSDNGGWRGGSSSDSGGQASASGGASALAGTSGSGGSGGASAPMGNTNISLSGAQDFGFFRAKLNAGQVPGLSDFDAAGFFAEHHTKLPPPSCGNRVCLQAMIGVLGSLSSDAGCTMLQLGLNSPIVADPAQRPPLSLAVVVDVSGSMAAANKIGFVRDGLEKLVDGLRDGDRVALLAYSDAVKVLFPLQPVDLKRADLRALVRGLQANGGTNFHDGLKAGFEQILAHFDSGRQNRVIMLSDGQPTVGVTSSPAIIAMSRAFNSDGVGLTTIGLGTDFNAQLMRTLAQQADGNFYFLENAGAVSEVFTEELSYFTVPVAFDLKLSLESSSHYGFGRAYGTPLWKDNDRKTGGTLEVPSVFLAHRAAHDDQTVDGGRRGGGSALLIEMMPHKVAPTGDEVASTDVAVVDVQFREPGSNRIVTDKVTINYPFAPWVMRERGHFAGPDIAVVQKSFVMLNMYVAIENAVRSFHTGLAGTGEAVGGLRRLLAAVADYNEEIADQDIAADVALVRQLIEVLVRNGARDPEAPRIPANPWPAD